MQYYLVFASSWRIELRLIAMQLGQYNICIHILHILHKHMKLKGNEVKWSSSLDINSLRLNLVCVFDKIVAEIVSLLALFMTVQLRRLWVMISKGKAALIPAALVMSVKFLLSGYLHF